MTATFEFRELCAQKLSAAVDRVGQLTAFVGLDGFVDEILDVVDKRMDARHYERKLLGFDNAMSVLTGVAASGYYVRAATSPSIPQLAVLLRKWPGK